MPEIYSIGHSNKSFDDFLALLQSHQIQCVADVRRFPMSRRHPHFAKDALGDSLRTCGIEYQHVPDLGGRRSPRPNSMNTNWKNAAFRGYADYMETQEFGKAIDQLMLLAKSARTAIMCAEVLWWQCHRSLIADHLKAAGWTVMHILSSEKTQEHPFTSAARIVAGRLSYAESTLFDNTVSS